MLWPFNHFRKPRIAPPGTIEAIYGMIVTQAREPLFYRDLAVPDTVNGRFDLVLLHLWLVLRRLKSAGSGTALSQALFDHFCSDMDDNLREMGIGDQAVPKRMRAFGEAFAGAICRNVLDGEGMEQARQLAAYAEAAMADLAEVDDATLLGGAWRFRVPKLARAR